MSNKCWLCGETNTELSFHRFPRNEQLRKLWIKATGREYIQAPKNALLCSKHFIKDCYALSNGRKGIRLKTGSVPSLFGNCQTLEKSENVQSINSIPEISSQNMPPNILTSTKASNQITTARSLLKRVLSSCEPAKKEPASKYMLQTSEITTASTEKTTSSLLAVTPTKCIAKDVSRTPIRKVSSIRKYTVSKPCYVGHCKSEDFNSPKKAKRNWQLAISHIADQRKKIKTAHSRIRRLKKVVFDLKSMLKVLTKKT